VKRKNKFKDSIGAVFPIIPLVVVAVSVFVLGAAISLTQKRTVIQQEAQDPCAGRSGYYCEGGRILNCTGETIQVTCQQNLCTTHDLVNGQTIDSIPNLQACQEMQHCDRWFSYGGEQVLGHGSWSSSSCVAFDPRSLNPPEKCAVVQSDWIARKPYPNGGVEFACGQNYNRVCPDPYICSEITPTPTRTLTPPPLQCGSDCNTLDDQCPKDQGLVCASNWMQYGTCGRDCGNGLYSFAPLPNCPCPTITPSPTQTLTPSPTPTRYCPEVSGECRPQIDYSGAGRDWGLGQLSWEDVPFEDYYQINRDGFQQGSADKDTISWHDPENLVLGQSYLYSVNPVNFGPGGSIDIKECPEITVSCPITPTVTPSQTLTPTPPPESCDPFLMLSYGNETTPYGPSQLYRIRKTNSSYSLEPVGDRSHRKLYNGIGFNPADNYLYGIHQSANSPGEIYRININSGAVEDLGVPQGDWPGPGQEWYKGTFLGNGKHFVVSNSLRMVVLDIKQRPARVVANHPISDGGPFADIAYNPVDGKVYGYNNLRQQVEEINPYTGEVRFIGSFVFEPGIVSPLHSGGAFFDEGGTMYLYGRDGVSRTSPKQPMFPGGQVQNSLYQVDLGQKKITKVQKLVDQRANEPKEYNNADAAGCFSPGIVPPVPVSAASVCGCSQVSFFDENWKPICPGEILPGKKIKVLVSAQGSSQQGAIRIFRNGVNVTDASWCNNSDLDMTGANPEEGRKVVSLTTGRSCQIGKMAYQLEALPKGVESGYYVEFLVPQISGVYDVYGEICCGRCEAQEAIAVPTPAGDYSGG